jgi:hypothetical protein
LIIAESHDEKAPEKREPESVTAMLMRKKEERKRKSARSVFFFIEATTLSLLSLGLSYFSFFSRFLTFFFSRAGEQTKKKVSES